MDFLKLRCLLWDLMLATSLVSLPLHAVEALRLLQTSTAIDELRKLYSIVRLHLTCCVKYLYRPLIHSLTRI